MNNQERAESARKVLEYFGKVVSNDDDIETLSIDLICNIKHLLDLEELNQERVFELADDFFNAEVESER